MNNGLSFEQKFKKLVLIPQPPQIKQNILKLISNARKEIHLNVSCLCDKKDNETKGKEKKNPKLILNKTAVLKRGFSYNPSNFKEACGTNKKSAIPKRVIRNDDHIPERLYGVTVKSRKCSFTSTYNHSKIQEMLDSTMYKDVFITSGNKFFSVPKSLLLDNNRNIRENTNKYYSKTLPSKNFVQFYKKRAIENQRQEKFQLKKLKKKLLLNSPMSIDNKKNQTAYFSPIIRSTDRITKCLRNMNQQNMSSKEADDNLSQVYCKETVTSPHNTQEFKQTTKKIFYSTSAPTNIGNYTKASKTLSRVFSDSKLKFKMNSTRNNVIRTCISTFNESNQITSSLMKMSYSKTKKIRSPLLVPQMKAVAMEDLKEVKQIKRFFIYPDLNSSRYEYLSEDKNNIIYRAKQVDKLNNELAYKARNLLFSKFNVVPLEKIRIPAEKRKVMIRAKISENIAIKSKHILADIDKGKSNIRDITQRVLNK